MYSGFTYLEISELVSNAICCDCEKSLRKFTEKHGKAGPPARTLLNWKVRFQETLTVLPKQKRNRSSDTVDRVENDIVTAVGDDPRTSQRELARQINISVSTVNKVIKKHGFKAYKIKLLQELHDEDHLSRIEFCTAILQKCDQIHNFYRRICFSDEASFSLNGSVNRHNCFYYSRTNEHVFEEKPCRSPSVNVWAMITFNGIHFRFFNGILNGEKYCEILNEVVVPYFTREEARREWFQHDGAPPHFSRAARDVLNEHLPGRWIGRAGPLSWPPRSCDLTLNDFWLWGHVRDCVYKYEIPDLETLQTTISNCINNLDLTIIARTYENFIKRIRLCNEQEGGHIEQLL